MGWLTAMSDPGYPLPLCSIMSVTVVWCSSATIEVEVTWVTTVTLRGANRERAITLAGKLFSGGGKWPNLVQKLSAHITLIDTQGLTGDTPEIIRNLKN